MRIKIEKEQRSDKRQKINKIFVYKFGYRLGTEDKKKITDGN